MGDLIHSPIDPQLFQFPKNTDIKTSLLSFLIAYSVKTITLFFKGRFSLYLFMISWQHSD
jgi:hypothetical protein